MNVLDVLKRITSDWQNNLKDNSAEEEDLGKISFQGAEADAAGVVHSLCVDINNVSKNSILSLVIKLPVYKYACNVRVYSFGSHTRLSSSSLCFIGTESCIEKMRRKLELLFMGPKY